MPALTARLLDNCALVTLDRIDTVGSHSRTFDAGSEDDVSPAVDTTLARLLGVVEIVPRSRRRDQEL